MQKIKTAISIDTDLLEETSVIAQELEIPRSQLVSLALEAFIRRYRHKQLLEQINAAYAGEPDEDDTATMTIIASHQRQSGKQGAWK